MFPQITRCPVCKNELTITKLYCNNCDTTIEGHFRQPQNPLAQLNQEQVQFILAFVKNEGRFNRLEEELGVSYPTLRNRLYEVIRALGFEPGKEEVPPRPSMEDRRLILEDLEEGRISSAEAQNLLRGAK